MIDPSLLLWCDRSNRDRWRLHGPDRAKFLHNYCTNDIKKLTPGSGCEAFVTSPQGKTIGYISALATEDSLLVRTDAGAFSRISPHFLKYGVFDDVAWTDVRESTFEIHLTGAHTDSLLARLGLPIPGPRDLDNSSTSAGDRPLLVVREAPLGTPGYSILGSLEDRKPFLASMHEAHGTSLRELTAQEVDGLRIAAGVPVFGLDITPENLPQEIGRDARTINFVKGCYLGQETVARLDALGHVNKLLMGLRVSSGDTPRPHDTLLANGVPAGAVTSSGYSPRDDRPVALAFVRIKHAPSGTIVSWDEDGRTGVGEVYQLPTP
ncbi:MAG: folate-binding protein YgfZ [Planctomycetota bacterium]|nr:folate-binding protein YgfZ [Planctomycetota bacterium]